MSFCVFSGVAHAENVSNTVDTQKYELEKEKALKAGFTEEQFTQIMKIPELESVEIIPDFEGVKITSEQKKIVTMAKNQLGKSYVWGADGPDAFDCGGLVRYVYGQAVGIDIPRGTTNQEKLGKEVNLGYLQPGDLLFWGSKGSSYHVALYIGNGQYIHAATPEQGVITGQISSWSPSFARRILKDEPINRPSDEGRASNERYIFRMYNPNAGSHHCTKVKSEAISLQDNGWIYEGVGWVSPVKGDSVYRLYNSNNGRHHYTMNTEERDNLITTGWKNEGVSWQSGGVVPIYRVYNPKATRQQDSHHFTASTVERDNLVRLGWKNEGIAWHAARLVQ